MLAEARKALEFTADVHSGCIVDILKSFYNIKVNE
jgi:hypothetical protein